MSRLITIKQFLTELSSFQTTSELDNVQRFFRDEDNESKFIGIRMADLFSIAKKFTDMPLNEVALLLESKYYEARMGAVCIMDFQARDKKTTLERKKELFDLYISKHNYIDNWDMVDRAAPYVVGGYLFDKPRTILYQLAKSENVWERRTSIVATYFFIRQNDIEDTFKLAEILVYDKHDLINKAVGSWIREAGKKDEQKLISFLDKFVSKMPRVTLRYAIEKLDKEKRDYYLKFK
jgi:3-methyladenine DNA glycosylase AlkD